jgi:outer membrane protein assembly factor BamB
MPQLEIQHANGNVSYAELTEAKPLLIGSGPNCDIVLKSPEVKRIHCRIVARDGRWRLEVATDAAGVRLGDKVVKAGTVQSGDVLEIGDAKIYIDSAAAAAAEPAAMANPYGSLDEIPTTAAMEDSEPSEPAQDVGRGLRKKSHLDERTGVKKAWDAVKAKAAEQVQAESDRPPGEERILGSPLVRWMLVAVAVIIAGGIYFYFDFRNRTIKEHFDKAQKAMQEGNLEGAIKTFTSFLEAYPAHDLSSSARVQRALCEVQSAATPTVGLANLRKMIREMSKEIGYPPMLPQIGETAAQVATKLAESARDRADTKALEQAIEAHALLGRDLPGTELSETKQADFDKLLEAARASIKKATERDTTIATMDQSIKSGKTPLAYAARERLVQLYTELVDEKTHEDKDEKLRELMTKAWQTDRDAVQWDGAQKAAETQPRLGAVVKSTTLVDRTGDAAPGAADNVQFVIAAGAIYAVDGAGGNVLWHMSVGLDSSTMPVLLPGQSEPTVVVTDTRHRELLAVRVRTGQLVWRQTLDEPLEAAPLFHRGKIYQPSGAGSLFVIDPATGRVDGRLQFGEQRLATTPVADASGGHLYVLGEQYVLYVITLGAPPKCDQVLYLAHRPDSVVASPLRMQRYLVLCENNSGSGCRLRVLLLSPDGGSVEEIQRIAINGWVHSTPAVFGNRMFVATDLETVLVYEGGPPEKADGFAEVPIKNISGGTAPAGTRPQAYSMFYSETDLLVVGSMVRHFKYTAEKQTLEPSAEKLPGAASQPIQRFPAMGNVATLYVARRVPNSLAVAFTAIDAASLEPRWEIVLGTGLLALLPSDPAKANWIALSRTGQVFAVPTATLTGGGVVDKSVGRVGAENDALSGQFAPLVLSGGAAIFVSGAANQLFVTAAAAGAPKPIELPAPLQAPLATFDTGVLAPAKDGRLYWISHESGKQLADPFQPPIQQDQPLQWRGVGVTDKKTVVAVDGQGNVYQIESRKEPSAHLAERGRTTLPKAVASPIAISGNVLCCVDVDNTLRTLDADALVPIGDWKLPAPATVGPLMAGGYILVVSGRDLLVCVSPQGQELWRQSLGGESLAGQPIVLGDTVCFVTLSGLVRALKLADGAEAWTINTEKPLAGGPVAVGELLAVLGDDGSLSLVKPLPAK